MVSLLFFYSLLSLFRRCYINNNINNKMQRCQHVTILSLSLKLVILDGLPTESLTLNGTFLSLLLLVFMTSPSKSMLLQVHLLLLLSHQIINGLLGASIDGTWGLSATTNGYKSTDGRLLSIQGLAPSTYFIIIIVIIIQILHIFSFVILLNY